MSDLAVLSAAEVHRLVDLGEAVCTWALDHDLTLDEAGCALSVLSTEWRPDA